MDRQSGRVRVSTFDIPDLEGLEAECREFSVTTADGAEPDSHAALAQLLHRVREAFGMDVVFVSEFRDGRRIFRHVDASSSCAGLLEPGTSDPLEESYCQRVVDGRLPQAIRDACSLPAALELPATEAIGIGAHLSVPIVLRNGSVYGTLCCFSRNPMEGIGNKDARTLSSVAELIATGLDKRRVP